MTMSEADKLAEEAEELDGYFSDAPLDPKPNYPPLHETFEDSVVITNLPKVPEAKVEKLTKVVLKLVRRIGSLAENADIDFSGLHMPYDKEKGSTLGFCLVEYETPEEAKNAVEVLEGYKFDKNHELSVCLYTRALKLRRLKTEEYQEAQMPEFVEKPNAMEWLEDPNQRDQFILRHGRETVVHWFDARNDPVIDYDGAREKDAGVAWCEYYCHWSPKGSYLATLVPSKGVILWSGKNYDKAGRFVAPDVKLVLFSPHETYLLTNNERREDPAAIKIYNVATGLLLRTFPLYPDNFPQDGPPPPFLWSHDDKYLARMGNGLISIFETPTMRLLDKKSLLAPDIHEFHWSPKANVLAYWAPERGNSPAHVDLIEVPSRKKLRQKNLFNVAKCNMVWQNEGEYLAVKVTRHTKSKKTLYNNIELFRLNESGIPVEMLDIKDAVMALAFEPRGSRFAMIHAENPSSTKVDVSFYDMMKQGDPISVKGKKGNKEKRLPAKHPELHKVTVLEGRQCTGIFWSPAGSNIILASLGDTASGTLEFYNVDEGTIVMKEHYRANQVAWDPAGRTLATVVSQPLEGGHFKFAMDNGYILWSFQGKQLYQQSFEAFYQFVWRPRETLLSKTQVEEVQKNLKKYEKQFDKADKERQRALYLEETKGKRMERAKYREVLARNKAILKRRRTEYVALLDGYDSDDDANFDIRDVLVETVLSTKEELVM
ncbi:factor 3 subunit B [Seminavis robusta]|uniref:Eukaryotic translation initiation factor 3 subunit B n=1 Tax=Seminavis robusta TaxID=568900 RepID=A0A9N8EE89_9STRA|nr:factor 3 subunit B [Seminavis robusta]|eukprot:Sro948_g223520.1 factor 3 subunit B (714) ;mRNA; r:13794-16033